MYLTNTRKIICFDVNTLNWYLVKPRHVHRIATKHLMRYLKGTIDLGLYYGRYNDYKLYGYKDSNWERVMQTEITPQVDVIFQDLHDLMLY